MKWETPVLIDFIILTSVLEGRKRKLDFSALKEPSNTEMAETMVV